MRLWKWLFAKRLTANGFLDTCNECTQQADWHVFIGGGKNGLVVNLCDRHFGDFDSCNRQYGGSIFPCRITIHSRATGAWIRFKHFFRGNP